MSFRQVFQEVTAKARSLESVDEDSTPRIFDIDADPRVTILMSWASVERAIAELAEARDIGRRMSMRKQVELLHRGGVIDDQLAAVLQDMRVVRNLIAHGGDVHTQELDRGTVQVYIEAAARLELIVERLQQSVD